MDCRKSKNVCLPAIFQNFLNSHLYEFHFFSFHINLYLFFRDIVIINMKSYKSEYFEHKMCKLKINA